MKLSRAIVLLFIGILVAQSIFYYPALPKVMASHYDGFGNPDRWMSKPFFFVFEAVILLLMLFVFLVIPAITTKIPGKFVNLPNKEYWLSDERRDETYEILANFNNWFCVGLIVLFIVVNQMVFESNINNQSLPTATMWAILLSFFALTFIWVILLFYQFRLPK